eukprot:3123138-Pleurochrysis_carterae.AAC.3
MATSPPYRRQHTSHHRHRLLLHHFLPLRLRLFGRRRCRRGCRRPQPSSPRAEFRARCRPRAPPIARRDDTSGAREKARSPAQQPTTDRHPEWVAQTLEYTQKKAMNKRTSCKDGSGAAGGRSRRGCSVQPRTGASEAKGKAAEGKRGRAERTEKRRSGRADV